jgi:hypothetical protein
MAAEFGRRLRDRLDSPRFARCRVEAGWGDMAGEHGSSLAADENESWNRIVSRTASIPIRAQRIGTNRIGPRLEGIRAALEFVHGGRAGITICPTNKPTIAAFAARYVWADEIDRNGDKRKIPDKSIPEANVMDATQYLVLSEHRGDGTSPLTPNGGRIGAGRGRRGALQAADRGIHTSFDVLEPYG